MNYKSIAAIAAMACSTGAFAQAVGFATLPPGSLNHTTASAVSMAMKEAKQADVRLLAVAHTLQTAFFVRKDSRFRTIADMKNARVELGYSAMRTIDLLTRAILATAGMSERDVRAVLVPNVVRGADDFASGASDMFFFAFGGPKVREIDSSIPLRVLEIDEQGMAAARKITPYGFLTSVQPGPIYIGVEKPMKVYSFDNLLLINAKTSDEMAYKILDTLEKNRADLAAVQPVLRAFSAANGSKKYDMLYPPGALKYNKDQNPPLKAME